MISLKLIFISYKVKHDSEEKKIRRAVSLAKGKNFKEPIPNLSTARAHFLPHLSESNHFNLL